MRVAHGLCGADPVEMHLRGAARLAHAPGIRRQLPAWRERQVVVGAPQRLGEHERTFEVHVRRGMIIALREHAPQSGLEPIEREARAQHRQRLLSRDLGTGARHDLPCPIGMVDGEVDAPRLDRQVAEFAKHPGAIEGIPEVAGGEDREGALEHRLRLAAIALGETGAGEIGQCKRVLRAMHAVFATLDLEQPGAQVSLGAGRIVLVHGQLGEPCKHVAGRHTGLAFHRRGGKLHDALQRLFQCSRVIRRVQAGQLQAQVMDLFRMRVQADEVTAVAFAMQDHAGEVGKQFQQRFHPDHPEVEDDGPIGDAPGMANLQLLDAHEISRDLACAGIHCMDRDHRSFVVHRPQRHRQRRAAGMVDAAQGQLLRARGDLFALVDARGPLVAQLDAHIELAVTPHPRDGRRPGALRAPAHRIRRVFQLHVEHALLATDVEGGFQRNAGHARCTVQFQAHRHRAFVDRIHGFGGHAVPRPQQRRGGECQPRRGEAQPG